MEKTYMPILTVPDLKRAIKNVSAVLVQARFGTSEKWVKISKIEASALVADMPEDATPAEFEFGSDQFGAAIDGLLYIG